MRSAAPVLCAVLFAAGLSPAQEPPRARFDVASVRQSKPGPGNWTYHDTPEGYSAENIPLASVICWAYHIKNFQLTGGPAWIRDPGFDINAKAGRKITDEERTQMVRSLLEDRFHLKVSPAKRQATFYALVAAKNGPRLSPNNCDIADTSGCGGYSWGEKQITGTGVQLPDLADMLSDAVDRPVIDQTGLTGRFDFRLHWALADGAGADADSASIYTAIQEQLGLKLEVRKGPVEMLSIEHVAKPDDN